jgi:hypothetical protein
VCAVLASLLAAAVAFPAAPAAIAEQQKRMEKARMDAARACQHSDWPEYCRRHWGTR